jgi:O-antigen ligase/Flp pilus assembly protein TadD
VLVPALPAVALLVYWTAHGGGYAPSTWEPSAVVVLGLLVAAVAGLGFGRLALSRPAAISLAALTAYVAWSYLSIAWAAAPGDALEGSNRALLYLLLFALFAVLPWRPWTAVVALSAFAVGIGAIAVVALARTGTTAGALSSFTNEARLVWPTGYENANAAAFLTGALVSIGLAARRELPVALRAPLLALATAMLQASVLPESRGWLFALPVVLAVAIALMPGRVRFVLWSLPPIAGTLLALPALLDVFHRVDEAGGDAAGIRRALVDAGAHASAVALPLCAGVLVVALALALADRRATVPAGVARGANRVAAGLAIAVALAGVAAGLAATHGRPDRTISHYWNRSNGYKATTPGTSRFALIGSNRPDFWRVSLDATAAQPLTGLGQDNWGDYYLAHRRTYNQPRWTHSLELRLLAHTGIVGLLLFAGFLAGGVLAAVRGRGRAGALRSAVAATALLPLVVWVVHGSIDWFWEVPALSGPALAFLGLGGALMRQVSAPEEPPAATPRRRLAAVALGAGAVLAAIAIGLPYLAERDVNAALAGWRGDPAAALTQLSHAADLNPLSSRPDAVAGTIALQLGHPQAARRRFSAALARDSGNWFLYFGRGLAESEAGAKTLARADYEHAYRLDPREPLVVIARERVDSPRPLTVAQAVGNVLRGVRRLKAAPR